MTVAYLERLSCSLSMSTFHHYTLFSSDSNVLQDTMIAHTDAVWGLSVHNTKMQLLSCSGDGTVRLWSPGIKSPLLNTFTVDNGKKNIILAVQ